MGSNTTLYLSVAPYSGGNYDFKGKTVIPFCTYAATYRDETLVRIAELTPTAGHRKGFSAVGRNTNRLESWLRTIHIIR